MTPQRASHPDVQEEGGKGALLLKGIGEGANADKEEKEEEGGVRTWVLLLPLLLQLLLPSSS